MPVKYVQLKNIRHILFCAWSNETFNPSLLMIFPRLRTLRFESGTLSQIESDFPKLKNLKVSLDQMPYKIVLNYVPLVAKKCSSRVQVCFISEFLYKMRSSIYELHTQDWLI